MINEACPSHSSQEAKGGPGGGLGMLLLNQLPSTLYSPPPKESTISQWHTNLGTKPSAHGPLGIVQDPNSSRTSELALDPVVVKLRAGCVSFAQKEEHQP